MEMSGSALGTTALKRDARGHASGCGGDPGRANSLTQAQTTVLAGSAEEMDLDGRRPRQAPAPAS